MRKANAGGIVSQADIARIASEKVAGHVVKAVSRETSTPSRVGINRA
jgi:hypothetical protein